MRLAIPQTVFAALLCGALAYGNLDNVGPEQHTISFSSYDEGLFTPFGDIHALSSSEFTTLGHPAFPYHSVRVKESHFCDGNVRWVPSPGQVEDIQDLMKYSMQRIYGLHRRPGSTSVLLLLREPTQSRHGRCHLLD